MDYKRRLLQYYLIIIGVTSFLLQNYIIHTMLLGVIVTHLTFSERESNLKVSVALRSFYILPKSFLLQSKITKALRKEGILE
jgi:hypothetical protein